MSSEEAAERRPGGAREAAFVALRGDELPTRALAASESFRALSPADRRLARELVFGVERRRATLDAVIGAFVRSRGVARDARTALRIGLYQALFLERVPPHAAVDETVEVVRLRRGRATAGFVNAVLRSVNRATRVETAPAEARSSRDSLVVGARLVRFDRAVFPDPERERIKHLAAVHSHPVFLVARWVEAFGAETAEAILLAGNATPAIAIRTNRLRADRGELRRRLEARGFSVLEGSHPAALRLGGDSEGIFETEEFQGGLFSVQDETAMEAADDLGAEPGERVLDLCAAPGGKATGIAEAMEDRGEVVAADVDPERLAKVEEAARRLGLSSVRTYLLANRPGAVPPGEFDRILVDAPCSNTGVLARRPEARWRVNPRALGSVVALQRGILRGALRAVRPGGVLVYSTCSLEPEENGLLVRGELKGKENFRLVRERLRTPQRGADGGFVARIERQAPERA